MKKLPRPNILPIVFIFLSFTSLWAQDNERTMRLDELFQLADSVSLTIKSAEKQSAFAQAYFNAIPAEARATQCLDCEACMKKCPQQIRIPNQMERITALLKKK